MNNFTYQNPTKILFGKDTTDRLAEEMKERGKNVLIVYGGGSIKKNGLYDRVMGQLDGKKVYELPGVDPNPRLTTVPVIIFSNAPMTEVPPDSPLGRSAKRLIKLYKKGNQPRDFDVVPSSTLGQGDLYVVKSGDIIPADGEVVDGIASVDE